MPERHSLFDTIADQIAPVHADGYKFLAIASGLTLFFFLLWSPLGWLAALVTAWIAYFFRDPPRVTPLRDGLVIAPGDGKICAVERVRPPGELGLGDSERLKISIFLSVFDVHINRAPVAGRIARSVYVQGSFINAAADKASELNERRAIVIAALGCNRDCRRADRRSHRPPHRHLRAGGRERRVRPTHRPDPLWLARGCLSCHLDAARWWRLGQRAVGGETVLADLRSPEMEREARLQ